MAVSVIPANSAFSAGAHLWIVPDLDSSKWARNLDWNLAFQLKRATTHRSREISKELFEIMKSWDFTPPARPYFEDQPLMIASESLLPNLMTVQIPFNGDAQAWANQCQKTWRNLGQQDVRIFLPDALLAEKFETVWPAPNSPESVQIVAGPLEWN